MKPNYQEIEELKSGVCQLKAAVVGAMQRVRACAAM